MPSYNFKKKVKLYVVSGGLKYLVDIYPDVSFSQTFNEETRTVKTLHTQTDMFERAVITKANPANFNFTIPLYIGMMLKPVVQLLLDYDALSSEVVLKTADIYVDSGTDIYKLEKSVFENGVFQISKGRLTTLAISGTASKLFKYGPTGTVIPGVLQETSEDGDPILIGKFIEIKVDNEVQPHITSASLEIVNEIQWVDNNNLHKSLAVNDASDTVYPEAFVVSKRFVSGAVQQYVTDETNENVNSWEIGVPMSIKVGDTQNLYTLDISMPSVVYTNRIDTQELFIQSYDYRLLSQPTNLSTIIKYE